MSFEMTDTSRTINIFNLRADTREFIGRGQAYVPAHTGLPANCTTVAPPEIQVGHVAIFTASTEEWAIEEDHRGETVYSTSNGAAVHIMDIGALPENTTAVAPAGPYQKWDGKEWVTDTDAETAAELAAAQAVKQDKIDAANDYINTRQWPSKLALGRLSDAEKALFNQWLDYLDEIEAVTPAADADYPAYPSETSSVTG